MQSAVSCRRVTSLPAASTLKRAFKLAMKWSRLSPIAIAKQKFGRDGVFEFGKGFFKLMVFSGILGLHLVYRAPVILATMQLSPAIGTRVMLNVMIEFLFLVMLAAGTT